MRLYHMERCRDFFMPLNTDVHNDSHYLGGGRAVRRCWVNFQCQGVLQTWLTVGQGPIVLSVGAGGGCLDIFSLIYSISILSPSLWKTARYRLKYCLKGLFSPKQPTNQISLSYKFIFFGFLFSLLLFFFLIVLFKNI